jgi:carboxymethylenebutenolidase
MGGVGYDSVKDFYTRCFVGRNAADLSIESLSRTVGDERIVDEMLLTFTHDVEVPWILPGVAATDKKIVIPVIGIVGFEGTAVASEHIYWDQAAVLAQVGLLDTETVQRLPMIASPHALLDGTMATNELVR